MKLDGSQEPKIPSCSPIWDSQEPLSGKDGSYRVWLYGTLSDERNIDITVLAIARSAKCLAHLWTDWALCGILCKIGYSKVEQVWDKSHLVILGNPFYIPISISGDTRAFRSGDTRTWRKWESMIGDTMCDLMASTWAGAVNRSLCGNATLGPCMTLSCQ